jgi:hypothetical protein
MNTSSSKVSLAKSKLVVIGIVLMFFGSSGWPPLARYVATQHPYLRIPFGIAGDVLVLTGATCAFIGWLRFRRAENSHKD